jgi:hypothetical protein
MRRDRPEAPDRVAPDVRAPADERLRAAVELLAAAARDRLRALGNGGPPPEPLRLDLRLPLAGGPEALAAGAAALERELAAELRAVVAARSLWPPGRVLCARCAAADCEHAAPRDPRAVFAGWGPSGVPRFLDLGQLLLERGHPRVDDLYREGAPLVALALDGEALAADLLPAYRERLGGVRLHGQVVAGWYRPPGIAGVERAALAFGLLSAGHGRRRRYALHPMGAAADPRLLEALHDERGRQPWAEARRWAEATLAEIAAAATAARPLAPGAVAGRLAGLLRGLAERLERPHRSRQRRTAHGERRHHAGHRPTPTALADLRAAPAGRVLHDPRHDTFVVLGPRGRTHVFGSGGKLVTSVRYPAATIERRQKLGHWRPLGAAAAAELVARVEELVARAGEEPGPEGR